MTQRATPADRALVRNSADPDQVRQAGEKTQRREEQEHNAWGAVLHTREGRLVLQSIIQFAGVKDAARASNEDQQFSAGMRNVGNYVLAKSAAARPDLVGVGIRVDQEITE